MHLSVLRAGDPSAGPIDHAPPRAAISPHSRTHAARFDNPVASYLASLVPRSFLAPVREAKKKKKRKIIPQRLLSLPRRGTLISHLRARGIDL